MEYNVKNTMEHGTNDSRFRSPIAPWYEMQADSATLSVLSTGRRYDTDPLLNY